MLNKNWSLDLHSRHAVRLHEPQELVLILQSETVHAPFENLGVRYRPISPHNLLYATAYRNARSGIDCLCIKVLFSLVP